MRLRENSAVFKQNLEELEEGRPCTFGVSRERCKATLGGVFTPAGLLRASRTDAPVPHPIEEQGC